MTALGRTTPADFIEYSLPELCVIAAEISSVYRKPD
jgi:hypothetical protein